MRGARRNLNVPLEISQTTKASLWEQLKQGAVGKREGGGTGVCYNLGRDVGGWRDVLE